MCLADTCCTDPAIQAFAAYANTHDSQSVTVLLQKLAGCYDMARSDSNYGDLHTQEPASLHSKSHPLYVVYQGRVRREIILNLQPGQALMTMAWAMEYLPKEIWGKRSQLVKWKRPMLARGSGAAPARR